KGSEYKNLAECTFGIMLHLELQEGKEEMGTRQYNSQYPKHTALVLRIMQNYLGKGHILYGDSAFASLSTAVALLERNTFFTGLVKTAYSGFPKAYLNGAAWEPHPP
ncbi:hypothetical protein GUITHDRAFT_43362, partial [Guillardia theta CCMP2712]